MPSITNVNTYLLISRWNILFLIILSLFFLPRQWKQFYVILQDQVLHFYKDQKTARAVSFLSQISFLPRVYSVPCLLEVKHPSPPENTSSWTRPISDVTLKLTKPLIGWENDAGFFNKSQRKLQKSIEWESKHVMNSARCGQMSLSWKCLRFF